MKTEWKVLVSLLVLLLLMEAGVRLFETRLSKDLAHLRELPAVAERMKKSDAFKILIVGNSLARYAINQEMLANGLENKGYGKIQVEAFYPDGTSITEWNYGLRRYFLNAGAIPDWIILVAGRTHLLDSVTSPERLGAYYVDRQWVKEAIFTDLGSVENTTRFFLARMSSLFANRARIQPFVFYNYLPAYMETIQEINDRRAKMAKSAKLHSSHGVTNLSSLLQVARSKSIAVSVVTVPMQEAYNLPHEISLEIGSQGAVLWDLSTIEGISANNFFDGYHLDAKARQIVTNELIRRLSQER